MVLTSAEAEAATLNQEFESQIHIVNQGQSVYYYNITITIYSFHNTVHLLRV